MNIRKDFVQRASFSYGQGIGTVCGRLGGHDSESHAETLAVLWKMEDGRSDATLKTARCAQQLSCIPVCEIADYTLKAALCEQGHN